MKFKLVYIVHGLILVLLLVSLFFEINRYSDYFSVDKVTWKSLYYSGIFRTTIFLIFPTIGIFLKNQKGWILVCQYFYFLVFLLMLMIDDAPFIGRFLIALIPILFIVLMNYKHLYNFYRINKEGLLKANMLSSLIGFLLMFLLLIIKDYYYL